LSSFEQHGTGTRHYRADIDGLRALAVLAVLLYHGFPAWLPGGFIGVDVFFVISGYLISRILFTELQEASFSFLAFYARRSRRLLPALLTVLLATLGFGWLALLADEFSQLGKHLTAAAGFVSNLVLWQEAGYFDNAAETKPLLHLWSLGVEEQFYLVWPLLLWLLWRMRWSVPWGLAALALLSFVWSLWQTGQDTVAAFYSPLTRLWELALGAALAWLQLQQARPQAAGQSSWLRWLHLPAPDPRLGAALAGTGLLLLAAGFWLLDGQQAFPGWRALLPVCAALLLIAAGPQNPVSRAVLARPWLVGIGLVSYPLYLWHWPLLAFARITEGEQPGVLLRLSLLLLSLLLAFLTWRWIEQPLRFGRSPLLRQRVPVLLLLLLLTGGLGLHILRTEGLPQRSAVARLEVDVAALLIPSYRSSGWICDDARFAALRCSYVGAAPHTVLLGDSHAPRIFDGLAALYEQYGLSIALFGGGAGCPPLLGLVSKDGPGEDQRRCLENTTPALQHLLQDESIRHVMLTGRGPMYTTASGFADYDGDRHDGWVLTLQDEPEGQRSNAEVYALALEHTFAQLLAAGKQVTFLYDVPELGFDIRSCVPVRPLTLKQQVRIPCAVSREAFVERNAGFRALVAEVLARHPRVHTVDLATPLCDDVYCHALRDGVIYYTDDDHLSRPGARHVVNILSDEFLALEADATGAR